MAKSNTNMTINNKMQVKGKTNISLVDDRITFRYTNYKKDGF